MKYFKLTMEYLAKNYLRLSLVALLPAIVIVVFMQPKGFGILFTAETLSSVETFPDAFFLAFQKNLFTTYPYMIVVGLGLLLASLCYTMGMIERHLKTGRLSTRNPFDLMNNAIIPVLIFLSLLVAIYIAFKLLVVCVLTFLTYVFDGLGIPHIVISIIVGISGIFGFVFTLKVSRPIMMASVTMLVYGYTFKDAIAVTVKMGDRQSLRQVDLALLTPFLIYLLVRALGVVLGVPEIIADIILTIMTVFLLQYTTTLLFVTFFDFTGIERRDLKKYY